MAAREGYWRKWHCSKKGCKYGIRSAAGIIGIGAFLIFSYVVFTLESLCMVSLNVINYINPIMKKLLSNDETNDITFSLSL